MCLYACPMSDPWIDRLPAHEREKIRKRMRSPEAYERLRERVKGPEDLAKEMERNEKIAELRFSLESDPILRERLKRHIEQDLAEQGIEAIVESESLTREQKKSLREGKFRLTVSSHPSTHEDQLMVIPEGKIQEKLPLKPGLSDRYIGQFVAGHREGSNKAA